MKVMTPCSAKLLVVDLLILVKCSLRTGSSPMEPEFAVQEISGIYTEPEVIWWYICTAEEVEWRESTTVRYLMQ